jgi:hypothetical protein
MQRTIVKSPSPNLGNCSNTGSWTDPSLISDCKQCVTQPGYYQEKQFYCDGKCMSIYDTNQECRQDSLVAKTISQCENPCYQTGPPTLGGGCSDDFDCDSGQKCIIQSIKIDGGKEPRGVCTNSTNTTLTSNYLQPDPSNPKKWPNIAADQLAIDIPNIISSINITYNAKNLSKYFLKYFLSKNYDDFYNTILSNLLLNISKLLPVAFTQVNVLVPPDNTDWNDANKKYLTYILGLYAYYRYSGGSIISDDKMLSCVIPQIQTKYSYSKLYNNVSSDGSKMFSYFDSVLKKCVTNSYLSSDDNNPTPSKKDNTLIIVLISLFILLILMILSFILNKN